MWNFKISDLQKALAEAFKFDRISRTVIQTIFALRQYITEQNEGKMLTKEEIIIQNNRDMAEKNTEVEKLKSTIEKRENEERKKKQRQKKILTVLWYVILGIVTT